MHNGIGVSPGVVVGVAYRVESVLGLNEAKTLESPALVPAEIAHFDRAVEEAESELEGLVHRVAQEFGPSAAEIFQTHLQILGDPGLLSRVHSLIEQQYLTALSALHQVMNSYAAQFARIEQDYFRERLNDLRDVILRVGSHLTRKKEPVDNGAVDSHDGDEPVILVAPRNPSQSGDESGRSANRRHRHGSRWINQSCGDPGAQPRDPGSLRSGRNLERCCQRRPHGRRRAGRPCPGSPRPGGDHGLS